MLTTDIAEKMAAEGIWTIFCGNSECSYEVTKKCSSGFLGTISPYSCINHAFIISFDILLLFICIFMLLYKSLPNKMVALPHTQGHGLVPISSAIFNGGLGLANLAVGIWIIQEKLRSEHTVIPLYAWLVVLLQGFTWLFLTITMCLKRQRHALTMKICSILVLLYAVFLCVPSLHEAIVKKEASVEAVVDILSFPGAILLLFCAFQGKKHAENEPSTIFDALYTPLEGEEADGICEIPADNNTTPFATAGLVSRLSFWWLNPLVKMGKAKILEEKDVPELRQEDRAETWYLRFMEQLSKRKEGGSPNTPSVFSTIFSCQRKAILISGGFALLKVLALTVSPLLLRAFIRVAEGKESFKHEGYALIGGLFLAKFIESLSERQWFFRTRLIGLQVRSLLSAAIYQKQLRLSNAAREAHSPGQIMNYVTVDAYKIGEFPFWFHQIWTTSLQICFASVIIYYSVGLATIAALIVIILTVVTNYPVAKLQHKYLTKLMVAQDGRLKAITETLANMKVLKLYAWETHFKNVIARLRKEELNWLSAVVSTRGYYMFLFWASPIIVSAVTFWTCYLIGIPLNASNVFTFLATIRLIQEPIGLIPDVAGVFIEAKVSFTRIVKFLEEPELQSRHSKQKFPSKELHQSVLINSTRIS